MGQRLAAGLARLASAHRIVGEARGIGLIAGLEIVDGHAEAPDLAGAVSATCMAAGLIVGGLRPGVREGNTVRLAPPLTVTADEIDEAVSVLDTAIGKVEAGWRR